MNAARRLGWPLLGTLALGLALAVRMGNGGDRGASPNRSGDPAPQATGPGAVEGEPVAAGPGPAAAKTGGRDAVDSAAGGGGPEEAAPELGERSPWIGRVVSDRDLTPVVGARVALHHPSFQAEALTGGEGGFRLEWPRGLAAQVAVEHPGFVDLRQASVDLEREGVFSLEPSASIRGRLAPWPPPVGSAEGAEALLWPHAASGHARDGRRTAIDADGCFAFPDLVPRVWHVTAHVPGAVVSAGAALELVPGEERAVRLDVQAGATLVGRVVAVPGGEPMADVEVVVRSLDRVLPPREERRAEVVLRTDDDGTFRAPGLAAGTQQVRVELPAKRRHFQKVELAPGAAEVERVFEVPVPARVRGVVLDAAENPVAGARVIVLPRGDERALEKALAQNKTVKRPSAVSAADGGFTIEGVAPGERQILVAVPPGGGAPGSSPLAAAKAGATVEGSVVRLPLDAALAGSVHGPDGSPLSGAEVVLFAVHHGATAALQRDRTEADGGFHFEGVPAGAVVVQAETAGHRRRRQRVELGASGAQGVRLVLEPIHVLEGRIVDERGAGITGVRLQLALRPGSPEDLALEAAGGTGRRYSATSDAYGRFEFQRLTPGTWVPRLLDSTWRLVRASPRDLRLPGDDELLLELQQTQLPPLAAVRGEVWPAGGGDLAGLNITGLGRGALVEMKGARFEARGLQPGSRRLTVRAPGFVLWRSPRLELAPGEEADLGRIELVRGTRLTVRVSDSQGQPVGGARVVLKPLDPSEGGPAGAGGKGVKLGERGRGSYRIEAVEPGKYRLRVTRDGFRAHSQKLNIPLKKAQETGVELRSRS